MSSSYPPSYLTAPSYPGSCWSCPCPYRRRDRDRRRCALQQSHATTASAPTTAPSRPIAIPTMAAATGTTITTTTITSNNSTPAAAPPPKVALGLSSSVPARVPSTAVEKPPRARISSGMISGPTQLELAQVISDRQVGDFKFIKTLGKGTFGKVKLAEHVVTKKLVSPRAEISCLTIPLFPSLPYLLLTHYPHIIGRHQNH